MIVFIEEIPNQNLESMIILKYQHPNKYLIVSCILYTDSEHNFRIEGPRKTCWWFILQLMSLMLKLMLIKYV